jgi:PAP2 superfamily
MKATRVLFLVLTLTVTALAAPPASSPRHGPRQANDAVLRWNQIAIDATGLDHATAREQLGPGRSSRAMAIVHIAMFDALNATGGRYRSYTGLPAPGGPFSPRVAVALAAHDTLASLFPAQKNTFAARLLEELRAEPNKNALTAGAALGRQAAAAILQRRAADRSQHNEPRVGFDHLTSNLPGHWRQDPISQIPLALGAYWGACQPFVLPSVPPFRAPPPPALDSSEYAGAFDEVKRLGGDGVTTPTQRTVEQTLIGLYWAYDGTPSLCAPPRLYNQIARQIADQMGSDEYETARLLALVNVAMADAGIAVWDSKYLYDYWRPVTGIREADPGTGPTGLGDGNANTPGDPNFTPLGAPASNQAGVDFTPPFPAYPSGHAGFGGALFQTLRRFYGTDNIAFTFVSDELNGVTRDSDGNVRPLLPRSFPNLSAAEEENGQSRIYLGIHWSFDKTAGIAQGRAVADYVFDHCFLPVRPGRR